MKVKVLLNYSCYAISKKCNTTSCVKIKKNILPRVFLLYRIPAFLCSIDDEIVKKMHSSWMRIWR